MRQKWGDDESLIEIYTALKSAAMIPALSRFRSDLHEPCTYDLGFEHGKNYGLDIHPEIPEMEYNGKYPLQISQIETQAEKKQNECVTDIDESIGMCSISASPSEGGEEVDLLMDPEGYTGYPASHSHKIWSSVYGYACSGNEDKISSRDDGFAAQSVADTIRKYCDVDNTLYKLVSGVHTSISIHLCRRWCDAKNLAWRSNKECYMDRVGNFEDRIDNFLFLNKLVILALKRSVDAFQSHPRLDVAILRRRARHDSAKKIEELVSVLKRWTPNKEVTFPMGSFSGMTLSSTPEFEKTVSKIFDCIECIRCRLWGKLQLKGLKTAIDIAAKSEHQELIVSENALVSLINLANNLFRSMEFMCDFECMKRGGARRGGFPVPTFSTLAISAAVSFCIMLAALIKLKRNRPMALQPQPAM